VGSFGISEGNITGRKKKERKKERNPTDCVPNNNFQQGTSPDTHDCHQQAGGLNRKVRAALLRVRTRPECPEGNLRELM
jgi:hypothetical protein